MRGSKEKKNLKITKTTSSNSNCFTSILKSFTCGGDLHSPTPSDRLVLPRFKSNGYIHPNANEPTSSNPSVLDQDEGFEAGFAKNDDRQHRQEQPGLVARLMGLESMPKQQDSILNLRSKSLNSLHLYIFPDTFLDHVSPSPRFSQHPRRTPCLRRAQSTSTILSIEPYTCNVEESVVSKPKRMRRKKVDEENERKTSKKNDRMKVDATKCRVNEDQRTRKRIGQRDDPRKEIKCKDFGTRLKKEKGLCRIRNVDELKTKVHEKGHHRNRVPKDVSAIRPRRRRSSRKIEGYQRNDTQGRNSSCLQGKKLCSITREGSEDGKEMMVQVIRLAEEECVRDDEWIKFDKNVREVGVDFAGEMLQVLINQLLDELLR